MGDNAKFEVCDQNRPSWVELGKLDGMEESRGGGARGQEGQCLTEQRVT